MTSWERFTDAFFNAKVMAKYLPDILSGAVLTIELAIAVIVSGLLAGLVLALVRSLGIRPLNWLIIFVVDLFRSLPPLVVLVLIYFGLPSAGLLAVGLRVDLDVARAGADGLRRGDLLGRHRLDAERPVGGFALHRPQLRADAASRDLPQALRLTIAPLTNRTIAITKGTALGTVVALHEILGMASSAMSNSYNPSPLMMGAAAYLVLFLPVVVAARWVETRFSWKR